MNETQEPQYYRRQFEKMLIDTLKTHSVVYLSGSRRVGKTTLAREICQGNHTYASFNSPLLLASVLAAPEAFFRSLPDSGKIIVDEAHFVPELFRYVENRPENSGDNPRETLINCLRGMKRKAHGAEEPRHIQKYVEVTSTAQRSDSPAQAINQGLPEVSQVIHRWLLIGTMGLPMLLGDKAARESCVKELTLLPFSAAERRRTGTNFLRRLLIGKLTPQTFGTVRLADEIEVATFPELALNPGIDREQWFDGFLSAVLQRDIQTALGIRNSERIVPLLVSLAARVGNLLNDASVIKETGLDAKTYAKYKAAAIHTFLTFEIEPWGGPSRLKKRFVKQSKVYFIDTSFLCYVMRRNLREVLAGDQATAGRLFENFVATEIIKQAAFMSGTRIRHFSMAGGREVDFVIEAENGVAVGIDITCKSVLAERDFGNLLVMRKALGKNFSRGFVIYAGTEQAMVSDDLWAVPVSALWE